MLIRRLEPSDRKDSFECGVPQLDEFLRCYAGQNQFVLHLGVTYVAVDDFSRQVVGFLTVAAAHASRDELPEDAGQSLPDYPLPVLRVARLAVDRRAHRRGLGSALVKFGCELAVAQAKQVGCVGIVVDAKPDAVDFYERFGFRSKRVVAGANAVRPRQVSMFLSLSKIKAALDHDCTE